MNQANEKEVEKQEIETKQERWEGGGQIIFIRLHIILYQCLLLSKKAVCTVENQLQHLRHRSSIAGILCVAMLVSVSLAVGLYKKQPVAVPPSKHTPLRLLQLSGALLHQDQSSLTDCLWVRQSGQTSCPKSGHCPLRLAQRHSCDSQGGRSVYRGN